MIGNVRSRGLLAIEVSRSVDIEFQADSNNASLSVHAYHEISGKVRITQQKEHQSGNVYDAVAVHEVNDPITRTAKKQLAQSAESGNRDTKVSQERPLPLVIDADAVVIEDCQHFQDVISTLLADTGYGLQEPRPGKGSIDLDTLRRHYCPEEMQQPGQRNGSIIHYVA